MNRVFKEFRFLFNFFNCVILMLPVLGAAWAAPSKKRPSAEERAKVLRSEQIKAMQLKSKELLDARSLSPKSKQLMDSAAAPVSEEEARIEDKEEKELAEHKRKLTPEEEEKVKKVLSEQAKNEKKAQGKLDLKADAESGQKGSKPPLSRTFRKDAGKSPVEYGNSSAVPGEADKEAIEFSGKPKKN